MLNEPVSRRAVLFGGLAGAGVALAACASPSTGAPPPNPPPVDAARAELSALEARFGGRLGVYAVDTGSGAAVGHRADERFLLCSTLKTLVVSAILRSHQRQPGLLDRVIHYDRAQLLSHAPVTSRHVADGMTVAALCEAAITQSDNTAANLLFQVLGGPPAVTDFARSLGDPLTRADRTEPELNVSAPGDERDTSTPARMAADLRALALGDALDPAGRELLGGWLRANVTGGKSIRAGLPAGWPVGDKTGSGAQGEVNDVAVVWPPGRAPLVIAVYTAPADPKATTGYATVAGATTIAVKALVPAA
nr:class A beta-lactamase [Amycolatopsis anabasis]